MISFHERSVLRSLAKQVAGIAALPIREERRELWKKHNSLKPTRPMILVFPEGAWQELLPERVWHARARKHVASRERCLSASTITSTFRTTL